jgi:glycosyltransferase involved in cell wall biosynthesis
LLIKAFAKLKDSNWCLVFVGKDQSAGIYKKLVHKLKLDSQVFFTGAVQIEAIGNYINYADVFVLPTRFDGWGVVLNEAASLAKPIISTEFCGAAWHLIEEGINGYRVKPGSVNALKKAMNLYIENSGLIKTHGAKSTKIFEKFTPKNNAIRLVQAVNEFCAKKEKSL